MLRKLARELLSDDAYDRCWSIPPLSLVACEGTGENAGTPGSAAAAPAFAAHAGPVHSVIIFAAQYLIYFLLAVAALVWFLAARPDKVTWAAQATLGLLFVGIGLLVAQGCLPTPPTTASPRTTAPPRGCSPRW